MAVDVFEASIVGVDGFSGALLWEVSCLELSTAEAARFEISMAERRAPEPSLALPLGSNAALGTPSVGIGAPEASSTLSLCTGVAIGASSVGTAASQTPLALPPGSSVAVSVGRDIPVGTGVRGEANERL